MLEREALGCEFVARVRVRCEGGMVANNVRGSSAMSREEKDQVLHKYEKTQHGGGG